ncbi:uncharacterized protein LOC121880066 [Homarus americanus]|uniref:Zinc finger and BTB domain-containing protein 24-like 1 n=1 Tax=Homarus americanus TaxID=6706 RepID=A0A8J5MN65_HOMAM|nr:uncharacterized protein LOC121880066 [Homarus americanus]KAG7157415.1 Zinc finger and BTB domain-containing protein 24-like 1 [Homarus americanus]
MARKCVLCGAPHSISLSVFAFPKSSYQRGAWVAAIRQIIPTFCDPQLLGARNGVCERHFQPQDIKKGKKSSLHRKAVPLVATNLGSNGSVVDAKNNLPVPFSVIESDKTRATFLIDADEDAFRDAALSQMSVDIKKEDNWQVDGNQPRASESCLGINIDDYLPSESSYVESEKSINSHAFIFNNKETPEKDVCLVCGKDDTDCNLICILRVHEYSGNISINLLLSKIVGRSKREVVCVSMKICSRCENLVQEVAQIEENLKFKKQVIKDMFETTLKEHKERSKVMAATCKPSDVFPEEINCSRSLVLPTSHIDDMDDKTDNCTGEQLSEKVRKSSRRQASSKKYRCPQCKEVYSSLALWVHHLSKHSDMEDLPTQNKTRQATSRMRKKHKVGIHSCEDCDKTFYCKQTLLAHASAHQKGSECSECGRYLTTKARLKAHLFKFHGIGEEKNKEVACQDCGKCFGTKAGLRYHRNVVHHVGTKYVCEHCNKMFYYHVPYRSHLLYAHGEKKIVCETCGDKFFTISKLNTHINAVHRSAQSWTCDECESKFTTYTAYRHHMNVKHLKVQHPCEYCDAQFRKKSSLMFHLWKHSVYICQLCRERFSCNDDLRTHMSVTHGKEVNWKGKRKQSTQLLQEKKLVVEEDVLQKNPESDEHIQESEHVASIVLNDLLITAEPYDNSSLQPFSLSACEKLPEKHPYTNDEDMKVKTLSIIDASQDLRAVDPVQFGTVETLEVKSSHDHIEMTPGVSLINVQILGDMEISQSDTLGDLKSTMLADAADHLSHDGQLNNEDNMTTHLGVETHLSGDHLAVGGDLEAAGHTLETTSHLETACHLEAADHLESSCHLEDTDHLDARNHLTSESHLEVPSQLESPHHLEPGNHLEVAGHINTTSHLAATSHISDAAHLDSGTNMAVARHLDSSNHLEPTSHMEPTDHLHMPTDIEDPAHLDSSSHLEVADQCSLPSMISQIETEVDEQMVNNPIVTQMDTEIHNIANEVDTQIVHHTETHMSQEIDQHIVKGSEAEMVDPSLDKQIEKIDEVQLEPFPVTLDGKGEVQYQYVMYISAPGEDNNPG